MSDFYKQAHAEQYPDGITKLISYATARMTRMPKEAFGDKLTVFGIQAYVKDFLIERFNETFFNVPLEEAMEEYEMIIGDTFPLKYVNTGKFEALHKLGYLPVEVCCLPEGTRVPIRSAFELPDGQCQVPFMSIVNTHPDFPWITEFLESVTSSEVWYPMAIANQAYFYRQIVNKWYGITGVADEARKSAISEFGFRGGKSSDAAIKASAAFLTSFNKTATIPAIKYMRDYYGDPVKEIGGGMISTEHSVMCSNFAVDGDEETFLKKLFSELYPAGAVSVVMDTYDYWANLQRCGKGELYDIIMNREGTVFFRGDSGDPVDIICGKKIEKYDGYAIIAHNISNGKLKAGDVIKYRHFLKTSEPFELYRITEDMCDEIKKTGGIKDTTMEKLDENNIPVEYLGTVGLLAKMFGYTTNEAGYKVLDPHVRAIYGDSITPTRAEEMYQRLAEKKFASNNVALGAGSFSTQCLETPDGRFLPFTRDSYGIAVKATWCADETKGEERQLFKNPKTDTGKFKKSQKGLIWVGYDLDGNIIAKDGFTSDTLPSGNMLQPIFRDGKMVKETTLAEIRNRLHNGEF